MRAQNPPDLLMDGAASCFFTKDVIRRNGSPGSSSKQSDAQTTALPERTNPAVFDRAPADR